MDEFLNDDSHDEEYDHDDLSDEPRSAADFYAPYLMRPLHDDADGLTVEEAQAGMDYALAVIRWRLVTGVEGESDLILGYIVDAMATVGHGARWYRAHWRRLVDERMANLMGEGLGE
jgi:hypothetical protein